MQILRLAALFLLILSATGASARQVTGRATVTGSYRYFDMKDGLPQMQVMSLMQDAQNFIWISTKGGLARWDGNGFEHYRGQHNVYGNSYPRYLQQININEYITVIGSALKQVKGKQVRNLHLPGRYSDAVINYFCPAGTDKVLIQVQAKGSKLSNPYREHIVYNYKTKKITGSIITKGIIVGIEDENNFYTSPDNKLLPGSTLYLYSNRSVTDSLKGITQLNAAAWIIHSKGLFASFTGITDQNSGKTSISDVTKISSSKGKFRLQHIPLARPLHLTSEFEMSWIYVDDTSYYYLDDGHVMHLVQGNTDVTYTRLESANCFLKDKAGNLWIGTEQGLYCFYRNALRKYVFHFSEDGPDNTWSMCQGKDDRYYIAEYKKGIYEYNDADKRWRKEPISLPGNAYKELLNSGSMAATRLWDGSVLLPLANGFAIKKEGKTKVFMPVNAAEIYSVTSDPAKRCTYIAAHNKAFRLNADHSLDTIGIAADAGLKNFLCSTLDRDGNAVFGGSRDKYSITRYKNGRLTPIPFTMGCIGMATDHRGNIWLNTRDSLFMYDDKAFHSVKIPANTLITSVKYYNSKWLIIGGVEEIILLDLEAYYEKRQVLCYRYDHTNGYDGMECAQNSMCIDDDSSVWIPAVKSTWRFRPDAIDKNMDLAQPVIDEILFSGKDLNWISDTTFHLQALSKDPDFRNLQFIFKAVKGNGLPIFYRYRLLNYQDDWSAPTSRNSATYNGLPYGTYTFEVQCSMDKISWSSATQSLPIILHPYLTETRLFKALISILAFITLTAGIIHIIKRHYKKKAAAQRRNAQLVSLKLQAIRSKAIPHFNSNVYNNIDFLIENGQYTDASNYLAILSRLHGKMLIDADKASHSLSEELDFVNNYLQLEKLRFGASLSYSITTGKAVDTNTQVPNMSIHTYVENAIKHGLMSRKGFGSILVNAGPATNGIYISVTDNGIGRKAAKTLNKYSTGMGLSILSQQIQLYNSANEKKIIQSIKDLLHDDGTAAGTECRLFIPFNFSFNKFTDNET